MSNKVASLYKVGLLVTLKLEFSIFPIFARSLKPSSHVTTRLNHELS
jgi:hypothetical protein